MPSKNLGSATSSSNDRGTSTGEGVLLSDCFPFDGLRVSGLREDGLRLSDGEMRPIEGDGLRGGRIVGERLALSGATGAPLNGPAFGGTSTIGGKP